ncbi:SDR family NAD(P)-dependent oxidoreductase [Pseudomonas fluorescens]|nr:SDR family NAD(P)-dependent oxidoreductase [Pseudomonas fluorescens]
MTGILQGKVALVTGAGHGIGRAHALELARQGAKVVVNDLGGSAKGEGSSRVAEEVCEIIRAHGGEAVPDFGDVGDEAQAEAMVQRGIDSFGKLDIVVNNAGIVRDKAIWNMSADDFDLVTRVHLRGTWLTCRAAARYWRERAKADGGKVYGRIINTTSGAGLLGNFGQSNYATAKAATVSLTLTLSLELASIGVTVNAIGPGGLTRLSAGDKALKEADQYTADEWEPLGPTVSSPLVAWLASEEAGYVSGQCIRAIRDKIYWMQGWTEAQTISNGNKPWKAEELGKRFATEVFGVRAAGLSLGG